MRVETAGSEAERGWVRRRWCFRLALGLLILGVCSNLFYLFHNCPIDLSEDEAHYWEWSRHLDYGYYSKPPGIAWVIASAVEFGKALHLTGDGSGAALMPVVRLPAVVFGFFSGLLSFLLARRMFKDDRAGLVVILLSAAVPMFAVGSLLITIDSPMYLCWAGTVYCLWRAVECDEVSERTCRRHGVGWLYAAGFCCAMGMLFKPVLIAVPLCCGVAAWADGSVRRVLKTRHSLGALGLVLLSQAPVVIWNWQHNWVTFRHILTQGGMGAQAETAPAAWYGPLGRVGEYVGGQAGGMGGVMFVLLVMGVVVAWKEARHRVSVLPADTLKRELQTGLRTGLRTATAYRFLLSFTLPLWGLYLVMNLWKRTEVNWPAASYFTGMILLAGIFTEGWNAVEAKVRRGWRVWGTIAIAWGVVLTAGALNMQRVYPMVAAKLEPLKGTEAYFKSRWHPGKWDLTMRLRGLQSRAEIVEKAREELQAETGMEPLLITSRYDTSSSLAFYLPGQPFVYSIMSSVGGRESQYDIWPGLNGDSSHQWERVLAPVKPSPLIGKPAVIVGTFEPWAVDEVLKKAFERVEGPVSVPTVYDGVELKQVVIWKGYGFSGMPAGKGGIF